MVSKFFEYNTDSILNLLILDFFFVLTEVALEREVEGDLFLADIGQGIPFRAGTFDGAISFVLPSSPQLPLLLL